MSIVSATEKGKMINLPLTTATANVAAQGDTIILPCPGAIGITVTRATNATVGLKSDYEWGYNTAQVNGTIAAGITALVYASATASTRPASNFYIMNLTTGEICYVTNDSGYTGTSGTMTIMRGCLGTTAAPFTETKYFAFLDSMYMSGSTAGIAHLVYRELPDDPRADVF